MLHHPRRARSWVASVATHGVAVVVGGVLSMAFGVVSQSRGQAAGMERETCPDLRPALDAFHSKPSVPSRRSSPSAPESGVARSNARHAWLELHKAQAEAALAELGGMPLRWESIADVPEGLRPNAFEALVLGVTSEFGLADPEIDCSEFPCVVLAPLEWTTEELVAVRERTRAGVEVDEPISSCSIERGGSLGSIRRRGRPRSCSSGSGFG